MTLNVDDIVRVVLTYQHQGAEVAQNVWHMKMVSGAGADEDDLLDAIDTNMQVAFGEIDTNITELLESTQLDLLKWDFVNHQWDGVATKAFDLLVGLSVNDMLPHGVAGGVRILTELNRRQGRTFIPGMTDVLVTDGTITAGFRALMAAYAAIFVVDMLPTGGTFTWCTFNTEETSPLYETASLSNGEEIVNAVPGYQRRRKPGVGI